MRAPVTPMTPFGVQSQERISSLFDLPFKIDDEGAKRDFGVEPTFASL
jgi:hypothetical protein